jgi:hypothetical protein
MIFDGIARWPLSSTLVMAAAMILMAAGAARAEDGGVLGRMIQYYANEWGKPPQADPNAPPSRWPEKLLPPQPVTTPPYPFTEWPFGGASTIGATLPSSQGGALMNALAPTEFGKWLKSNHIEIYGWINGGGNISNAQDTKAGNFPAAYSYKPNAVQLDQAVIYLERLPNTVQRDHIDWGFRLSAIYGETYRYTTSLGIADWQLQKKNNYHGYDFPMLYGELYIPGIGLGTVIRAGRFISVPDIEAQLAPNNYMYSHSMTYAYDNYTNWGVLATTQLSKNFAVTLGVLDGTEVAPWYNGDPGKQASFTGCLRYVSNSAYDSFFVCANALNNGQYGYNNLQWYGGTYYHKFNEKWHISMEYWHMHQRDTPDFNQGGVSPFPAYWKNAPFGAVCPPGQAYCTSKEWAALAYLNYQFSPMDNISWRAEYFDDENGQRTGTKARYFNYAVGWQHWFSPSVLFRPEIAWYNSLDGVKAFDTASSSPKDKLAIFSADIIWKF